MKRKLLSFILLLIMVFSCVSFVACGTQEAPGYNNPQQPDGENDNNAGVEFSLDYMKNLMVASTNVTGYSIKVNSQQTQQKSSNTKSKISLLSSILLEETQETTETYSLYSTSETYQYGNVEFDESIITKVTFKKNTNVTEDIYDNEGNLIDQSTTITQEQLDGKINKLYTTKDYTFIQFVAKVPTSGMYSYESENGEILHEEVTLRPTSLIFDEFGVADFDKTDYYSSALTASFVIDNTTKFIYKIDGFHIKAFYNGLVQDSRGYYYTITTDANNNLVFTDVLPNKEVEVNNVLKDKYGWIFVANDDIDQIVEDKKIIYTTEVNYVYDKEFNVYTWEYYPGTLIEQLSKVFVNGNLTPLVNSGLVSGLNNLRTDRENADFAFYKNMRVSNLNLYTPLGVEIVENREKDSGLYFNTDYAINAYWLDNSHDIFILDTEGILSYYYVDLEHIYQSNDVTLLSDDDLTQLSQTKLRREDDYYLQIDNDKVKITNVYSAQGINGAVYYKIVKNDKKLDLVELTSKSYEDSVYVFQPINR